MLEEDYKTQHSWNIRKSSMTAVSNALNLILHLRPTAVAVITIQRASSPFGELLYSIVFLCATAKAIDLL